MTLSLSDKWIWAFWFAQDGSDIHVFYLQAPREIEDESLRHWNASIGHAVSQDLINWEVLPDAFAPSCDANTWDNYTTWTGSIVHHSGSWYMFYTGCAGAEKGLIQRIGLATSSDLIHWQRYSKNPVIEADPRWYEVLDLNMWHDQAWRDPWIFKYSGEFHAYITARENSGDRTARGVIGHAKSTNLTDWEVLPPITQAGEFGYLEVPQLIEIQNRWYLLFSVSHDKFSKDLLARKGIKLQTGTHYLVSDSPFGPFRTICEDFLVGDEIGSYYSGKVILNPKGEPVLIAARMFGPEGQFYGEIIDPVPLSVEADGKLIISNSLEKRGKTGI